VRDGHLVITSSDSQGCDIFHIFGASDPNVLREEGSLCFAAELYPGVVAVGSHAYVSSKGPSYGDRLLHIIDISQPANPTQVGSYASGVIDREQVGCWALCGNSAVAAAGSFVYLATDPPGLRILDASDRANPTEVGVLQIPDTFDPQVFDPVVAAEHPYVYLADEQSGLVVLDVSIPTEPTLVGRYAIFNPHPGKVEVLAANPYVYMAVDGLGLFILRLARPMARSIAAREAPDALLGTVGLAEDPLLVHRPRWGHQSGARIETE
jgi:hypothetical protein